MDRTNTDWFHNAGWGIFTHYLSELPSIDTKTPDDWNRLIDAFDVDGLARQLADIHAGYYFITIGQNSGFYLSPNATYDRITGITPSKLSRRDLVADLAAALAKRNIPLLVYFTTSAPSREPEAIVRLQCTPPWDSNKIGISPDMYPREVGERTDERLTAFQRNWEAIIREWSLRWGRSVRGWWLDGAYAFDLLYNHPDEPNIHSFRAALKAGNPDSIVAFNRGVNYIIHCHAYTGDDFIAGEMDFGLPAGGMDWRGNALWNGRFFNGAQFHLLTHLGESWGRGNSRFPADLVAAYTRYIRGNGGVMTWDVPPMRNGLIPDSILSCLGGIGAAR